MCVYRKTGKHLLRMRVGFLFVCLLCIYLGGDDSGFCGGFLKACFPGWELSRWACNLSELATPQDARFVVTVTIQRLTFPGFTSAVYSDSSQWCSGAPPSACRWRTVALEPSLDADGPWPTGTWCTLRWGTASSGEGAVPRWIFSATSFPVSPNLPLRLSLSLSQDSFQDWAAQETDCPQNSE